MDNLKTGKLTQKSINKGIIFFLVSILIVLILFAPMVLKSIKIIPIMGLIFISFIMVVVNMKIPVHYKVFFWVLSYIAFNFIFLIRGTIDNSDVFIQLLPVNVIWPLLYMFVLIIPSSGMKKVDFTKVFMIATVLIELFILGVYLNFTNRLPDFQWLDLQLGQVINYNFGYINFFTPSITSLFFLLPYIVSRLLINPKNKRTSAFYISLLVVGIVLSIIIGRRALIAVVGASPFISFFWSKIAKDKKTKAFKIILIAIVMCITLLFFMSKVDIGLRLQNLDTKLIQDGTSVREEQFDSLIDGWKKVPVFGTGLGVNAKVVRSLTVPGMYELSYVAILFHTGIIGMTIYLYMILWLVRKLTLSVKNNKERADYVIPFLTGFTSLMLAEATNPYISSFDGMWVIFFALAIINNVYISSEKEVSNDDKRLQK